MAATAALRVSKDLKELNSCPNSDNPPILATTVDDKLDHVVALVLGPPDTPYHFGFFFFDLRFPQTYPNDPPKVKITTTDYGRTRFNPNLYADGKVCLSILGTWRGETTEIWRASYSVFYVLNAVQSMIMNPSPYHNEPGYEQEALQSKAAAAAAGEEGDHPEDARRRDPEVIKKEIQAYNDKILGECLRVAVCDAVESVLNGKTEYFRPLIKREFLLRYETYVGMCTRHKDRLDGGQFQVMPFEYSGNSAEGSFDFAGLLVRLQGLKARIDEETESWRVKGRELTARRSYVSSTLRDEHMKFNTEGLEGISGGIVDPENAFVWTVTIFGPEGTIYEGGFYNIEIVFSDDPNEIPRLRFLTQIFHPNVSPSGHPWFTIPPGKQDSVEFVLAAVKKLLSSEPNPSPATWVNEEAAKMCFSRDEDERKAWRRKARSLARQSMEE